MRTIIVAIWLLLGSNALAQEPRDLTRATPGYLYFNRPGATLSEHNSELVNCMDVSSRPSVQGPSAGRAPYPYGGVVGDWVLEGMVQGYDRARRAINIENCMVVRGWRLVRLDDVSGRRLSELPREQLLAELSVLLGEFAPLGEIVRVWSNEIAGRDFVTVRSQRNSRRTLLSELVVDIAAPPPAVRFEATNVPVQPSRRIQPIEGAALTSLDPDEVVLVVGLTTQRGSRRHFANLSRFDGAGGIDTLFLTTNNARERADGRLERTLVFKVRAGQWRLEGFSINFCFGAPSFTATGGDIIFVGEFDLAAATDTPNLTPESLEHHMAALAPEWSGRARPAAWTNGATWPCPAFVNSAFEFEGFPFEPGYRFGGMLGVQQQPVD